MRAPFIVLEGIDGAGTTTQRSRLCERLRKLGPVHATAEPSSGPIGTLIRSLLSAAATPIPPDAMALLFAADRRDHVAREVLPKLEADIPVVCDRYLLSSVAYQGAAGVSEQLIFEANFGGAALLQPDLTILVQVPTSVAAARRAIRAGTVEIYDDDATQEQVAARYRAAAAHVSEHHGWKTVFIDGSGTQDEVEEAVCAAVEQLDLPRTTGECPSCGAETHRSLETQEFLYGYPESVALSATVPVHTCTSCGEAFTDEEGAQARDAAVRAHLATSALPG